MKRNPGKLLLMLCLSVVGGGVVANAQDADVSRIEADVPFAFAVGHTELPAGKYNLKRVNDKTPMLLAIQSVNGGPTAIFMTEDVQTRDDQLANQSDLVFDRVGDQYFLSQVWESGSAAGRMLPESKMEKRLARETSLANNGRQLEKRTVVASADRT
jgi:hypothetical protein